MSHLLRIHSQCEYNHLLIVRVGLLRIIFRAIMVYSMVVLREMLPKYLFSNEPLQLSHLIALQLFQREHLL